MVNLNIDAKLIKGLLPAMDRRVVGEPFLLDAANIMLDIRGPYTAFGSSFVSYSQITTSQTFETFRVGSEVFGFIDGVVLAYDTTGDYYYPVFTFTPDATIWPTTMARVGGDYYFCRKGHPIWRYISTTSAWEIMSDVNIPTTPVSVTQSGGRLIILGATAIAWSAQDDGTNLAPSLVTGAGFQTLSILISGSPFAVLETPRGWLVYTAEGLLIGELMNAQNPFRVRALTTALKPLNPFCIVQLTNKEHVFLDKTGLYQTVGDLPRPWQPLMSEYLRNNILNSGIDLTIDAVINLHFDVDRQWFFVSISANEVPFNFTYAYALYLPRNEWGIFNRAHIGFGELALADGPFKGFNFGWICSTAYMHKFDSGAAQEVAPTFSDVIYWQGPKEYPTRIENGIYVFATVGHITSQNEQNYTNLDTGVYSEASTSYVDTLATPPEIAAQTSPYIFTSHINMQAGIATQIPAAAAKVTEPLNAYAVVGLFRYVEQRYPDETSAVTDLVVKTNEDSGEATSEDWLTAADSSEDRLTATGDEDWGAGLVANVDYSVEVTGTVDGLTVFDVYQDEPALVVKYPGMRHFSPDSYGVYHWIKIAALADNQSFHLRELEISGMLTGRL